MWVVFFWKSSENVSCFEYTALLLQSISYFSGEASSLGFASKLAALDLSVFQWGCRMLYRIRRMPGGSTFTVSSKHGSASIA